jgi:hypothetical protein
MTNPGNGNRSEAHDMHGRLATRDAEGKEVRLLIIVMVMIMLVSPVNAADMMTTRTTDSRALVILIKGDIVSGDYAKFRRIANQTDNAIVLMTSRGGLLIEGLNIGSMVRERGFYTMAVEYCMSVCGMMWLAGVKRSTTSDTAIGFHGAGYENGEPSVRGNALAGAYLANLGYSYEVIGALIKVGPKEMDWLSYEWARALGIQVYKGNCTDANTGRKTSCTLDLDAERRRRRQ